MPSGHAFAIYIPAALVLLAIPGPAVLYVIATSVEGGRRAGLLSVAGVHVGSIIHVAAACAGLSALIVSSAIAFSTVKYVGAAYLVFIGIKKWLDKDDLPDSIPRWPGFRETNAQLERFGKKFEIGLISNIDDKLLGATRRHFRVDWDLVVTAQQVRSYKPDPAHFKECARRIGGKKGWVHIASGYDADIAPALKMNVPVIWVNRHGEKLEGRKAPDATVKNIREAAAKLGAK